MRNSAALRSTLAILLSLALAQVCALHADEPKKEMVDNPVYKHWAAFKVGTTVTRREKVKLPADSEEGQIQPEQTLVKDNVYKLLEVTPQKVVVEVTEMEHGRGSIQESAPFKLIYFSHMRKGLGTPKESFEKHKQEDVEVEVHGKMYKATVVETTQKIGPVTKYQKVWLSDEVPGGIIKDIKSQKHGNDMMSESTLELVSVKQAP
jgi:hypothetical protein